VNYINYIADEELFSKAVKQSHHVLHTLVPPPSTASQNYNLRHRTHSLELPAHTTLNWLRIHHTHVV